MTKEQPDTPEPVSYTAPVLPAFTKPGDTETRYLIPSTKPDPVDYINATFEEFSDTATVTRDLDFTGVDIPGQSVESSQLPVLANTDLPVTPERESDQHLTSTTEPSETNVEPYIYETEFVDEHPELPNLADLPETVTVRTDVLIGLLLAYFKDHRFNPEQLSTQEPHAALLSETTDDVDENSEVIVDEEIEHDLDFDDVDIPGAVDEPTVDEPEIDPDPSPSPTPTPTATASSAHETWGTADEPVEHAGTPPRPDTGDTTDDESFSGNVATREVTEPEDTTETPTTDTVDDTESDEAYAHDKPDLGDVDDIRDQSVYDDIGVEPSYASSQQVRAPGSQLAGIIVTILGFGKALGLGIAALVVFLLQKTVTVLEGFVSLILLLYLADAAIILLFPSTTLPFEVASYSGRIAYLTNLSVKVGVVIGVFLITATVLDYVTKNNRYKPEPSPSRL